MAANQQFNLRWNNHTANILQVFSEQLSNESLVDVTLSCQGQFLKAHKMILSACSPYFQELFSLHQTQHPIVILNGINFRDLKMVIEFMYRGEIKVLEAELSALLAVAETLQIKGLSNVRNKYEKGKTSESSAQDPKTPQESQSENAYLDDSPPQAPSPKPSDDPLDSSKSSPKQAKKRKRTSDETKKSASQESSSKNSPKKTNKASTPAASSEDRQPNNCHVLPFVQVTMNESEDDLPSTIKVEPLFIRDIDDTDASWDDPSRLVIDLPSEEMEGDIEECKEEERPKKSKKSPKSVPIKTSFVPKSQLLKLRPTSELLAPSPTKDVNSDDAATATSSSDVPTSISESKTEDSSFDGTPSTKENSVTGASFLTSDRRGKHGKIPRPPNAFMIFANEWRRKLALENPCESNKQISVRLGVKWKNLSAEKKEYYYSCSRLADEEHKRKYPNYYYSPKEARLRKSQMQALRQKMVPRHIALSTPVPASSTNLDKNALHFVKVFVKSKDSAEPSVFLTSQAVEVKKEVVDVETSEQNLEEEFLKLVEEGHVEAEVEDSDELQNLSDSHNLEEDSVDEISDAIDNCEKEST